MLLWDYWNLFNCNVNQKFRWGQKPRYIICQLSCAPFCVWEKGLLAILLCFSLCRNACDGELQTSLGNQGPLHWGHQMACGSTFLFRLPRPSDRQAWTQQVVIMDRTSMALFQIPRALAQIRHRSVVFMDTVNRFTVCLLESKGGRESKSVVP